MPDAIEFRLGGRHQGRKGLHQRPNEDGSERLARALVQPGQELLIDQFQGFGQLTGALEGLLHELARARPGVTLGLHLVEAGPHARERVQVDTGQRLPPISRQHQAVDTGKGLADRPGGDLGGAQLLGAERDLNRRRVHAQHGVLEPANQALLPFGQAIVEHRRVVPGGLVLQGLQQQADGRVHRVTQALHALHGHIEALEVQHRDALDELAPLLRVLGLVELGQRLLDLFGTAFEGQVVRGGRLEHPVGGLQRLVCRVLDRIAHVTLPGLAGEGARDDMAAGDDLAVAFANDASHGDGREAGGGPGLDFAIHAFARRQPLDHSAQVLAGAVEQGHIEVHLRKRRVRHLSERERQDALGAADHLFAWHGAAVGLQPLTPVAGELVPQVAGLQTLAIAQHEVSLQGVVGLGDVAVGSRLIRRAGSAGRGGKGRRRGDTRQGHTARRVRRGTHGGLKHRLCAAPRRDAAPVGRLRVGIAQVRRQGLHAGLEQHRFEAIEVFLQQPVLDARVL